MVESPDYADEMVKMVNMNFVVYESVLNQVYWRAVTKNRKNPSIYRDEIKRARKVALNAITSILNNEIVKNAGSEMHRDQRFTPLVDETISQLSKFIDEMTDTVRLAVTRELLNRYAIQPKSKALKLLDGKRADAINRSYDKREIIRKTSRHFAVLVYVKAKEVKFRKDKADGFTLIRKDGTEMGQLFFRRGEFLLKENMHFFHPNSTIRVKAHHATDKTG